MSSAYPRTPASRWPRLDDEAVAQRPTLGNACHDLSRFNITARCSIYCATPQPVRPSTVNARVTTTSTAGTRPIQRSSAVTGGVKTNVRRRARQKAQRRRPVHDDHVRVRLPAVFVPRRAHAAEVVPPPAPIAEDPDRDGDERRKQPEPWRHSVLHCETAFDGNEAAEQSSNALYRLRRNDALQSGTGARPGPAAANRLYKTAQRTLARHVTLVLLEVAMTWRDKLKLGSKRRRGVSQDNLPPSQIRGPELSTGPGRSAEIPLARADRTEVAAAGARTGTRKRGRAPRVRIDPAKRKT
jgi:hypothetical protein